MPEDIVITASGKENTYKELIPQIRALIEEETDTTANLANICAALKYTFHFLWVGFYLVKENDLVLGPFQGPVACTRIPKGKGVCGMAWQTQNTIIVPDVNLFPGHIACSTLSKSEIVIPLLKANNTVAGVLDVDSEHFNSFDKTDELYLKQILDLLKF